jgi:hypothetical protein
LPWRYFANVHGNEILERQSALRRNCEMVGPLRRSFAGLDFASTKLRTIAGQRQCRTNCRRANRREKRRSVHGQIDGRSLQFLCEIPSKPGEGSPFGHDRSRRIANLPATRTDPVQPTRDLAKLPMISAEQYQHVGRFAGALVLSTFEMIGGLPGWRHGRMTTRPISIPSSSPK